MQDPIDRAYQEFANGIVAQAAKDYRLALRGRGYNKRPPHNIIAEIEKFFRSRYFRVLTSVSGEYLIESLKREYEEERNANESNISTSNP